MLCPKCSGSLRVLDNVANPEENENYRKRRCVKCGHEFYTVEFEVVENQRFKDDWSKHNKKNTNKGE